MYIYIYTDVYMYISLWIYIYIYVYMFMYMIGTLGLKYVLFGHMYVPIEGFSSTGYPV